MADAYRIAINISMSGIATVSSGLGLIIQQMGRANQTAQQLQRSLNQIKLTALAGGALFGAGYLMARGIEDALKPAIEYQHQLAVMNQAGMTHVQIAQSIGAAWETTSKVITTTATENLRAILDLRNIMARGGPADFQRALNFLPTVQMGQALLQGVGGMNAPGSRDFAFSALKALDIIGAVRDPTTLQRQFEEMVRAGVWSQGRITPEMYQGVFWYARQGKFGLNEQFLYQYLPSLMIEASRRGGGGTSRGVGPLLSQFARWAEQGIVNRASVPELEALGLVPPGTAESMSSRGRRAGGIFRGMRVPGPAGMARMGALPTTTLSTVVPMMAGINPANLDPFTWATKVVLPAIERRFGGHATEAQIMEEINTITKGNQWVNQLLQEFILKRQNYIGDAALIRQAMAGGIGASYTRLLTEDPKTALAALNAQLTNLKTAALVGLVPILIQVISYLTSFLNWLARLEHDFPRVATALAIAFTTLAGTMLFSGTVLVLAAAFRAMGVALALIGVPVAAITTAAGTAAGSLGMVLGVLIRLGGPLAAIYAFWRTLFGGGLNQGEPNMLPPGLPHAPPGTIPSDPSPRQQGWGWGRLWDWLKGSIVPGAHADELPRAMAAADWSPVSQAIAEAISQQWGVPGGGPLGSVVGMQFGGLTAGGGGFGPNNPGNIRGGHFATMAAGQAAIDRNLLAYQDIHGINTLAGIISRWAPPNENPTAALIANAARRTGISPFAPINLHDPATLAMVHHAIVAQEQGGSLARWPGPPPSRSHGTFGGSNLAVGGAMDVYLDGSLVGEAVSRHISRGLSDATSTGLNYSGARPDWGGGPVLPGPR